MARLPRICLAAVFCSTTLACGPSFVPTDAFTVRPGVETVTVTEAEPSTPLTLYNAEDRPLITLLADEFGQAHFAYVPHEHMVLNSVEVSQAPVAGGVTLDPGDGYYISNDSASPPERSADFRVLAIQDTPDPSLYERQVLTGITESLLTGSAGQDLNQGFNYIEVRDGVKLSAMVRFPDPDIYGPPPYPTVIEYSGYSPSRPTSIEPASRVALFMGYATVGVNMRGTGCSGGVFDVFNPAQHADAYDVIEVVARQSWVLHQQVGMVGLSYAGISQLFAGRTNPPSLAAISPMSVIADPWEQLWPGGLYNNGFTRQWLEERDRQAAAGGQSWTDVRISEGDTICEAHQTLRNQNIDFGVFLRQLEFYPPDANERSLPHLVREINVPVFLTGAFQDEQTGPQFGNMIESFTSARAPKFMLFNGRHPDGFAPFVVSRWFEFLEFYVAERVPKLNPLIRLFAPDEISSQFGVKGLDIEPDRFDSFGDDHAAALASYEAEPKVRVMFESGAVPDLDPGAPMYRFEASYDQFPPSTVEGRSFFLGAQGALLNQPEATAGLDAYLHDAAAAEVTFFGPRGYELMAPLWDINWTEFAQGDVLSYLTEPLTEDLAVLGPGWVELWLTSPVDDARLQVTLTEVYPDDHEVLVTSGWLRAGHRKIDTDRSTQFHVTYSFREQDFQPLEAGVAVNLKVAIPPVGHVFRAGSRLRLMVSSPGRNHGTWTFEDPDYAGPPPRFVVSRGGATPSRLYLPIAPDIQAPAGLPACPSLRGQPCRPYEAKTNQAP